MTSRDWTCRTARRSSAVLAATALAVGVAACGGSAASSTTTTPAVHAPQAPTTAAGSGSTTPNPAPPTTTPAPAPAPAAPAGASEIPDYQPSTLVNKNANSTVLTSPDSVTQIGEFYRAALAKGGWQVRSAASTAYSASFSAHRSSEGVSISVYPRGSGSGITISTRPE